MTGSKVSWYLNPGEVRSYLGTMVIIVHQMDHRTVWVRYEDDRTNTEYLVNIDELV